MQAVVAQPHLAQALRAFTGLKLWKLEASHGDPAIIVETNGSLILKGTDLALFLAYQVEATGEHASGQESVAVPYTTLKELARRLPKKVPVTVQVSDQKCVVQSGDLEVTLPGKPAADFVSFPDLTAETSAACWVDPAVLREAILDVVFAASSDKVRPAMTAVFTRLRGETMTLVGADGFRLAQRVIPVQDGTTAAAEILIPAPALKKLAALLAKASEPVRLGLHQAEQAVPQERSVYNPATQKYEPAAPVVYNDGFDRVTFQCGPLTLATDLVEARYPDYEAIIPLRYRTRLVVPRAEFLARLELLAPLIKDRNDILVLSLAPEGLLVRDNSGTHSFSVDVREGQSTLTGFFLARSGELEGEPEYEPSPELLGTAAEIMGALPWPCPAELCQGLAQHGPVLSTEQARAILDLLAEAGVVDTPGVAGYPLRITDPEKARARVEQWLHGRRACAFNIHYLTDLVKAMDSEAVAIDIQDFERPGVFWPCAGTGSGRRPDEHLYVVMPMQL